MPFGRRLATPGGIALGLIQKVVRDLLDAPPQRFHAPSGEARLHELAQSRVIRRVYRDDAPGEQAKLFRYLRLLLLYLLWSHGRAGIYREAAVEQGSDDLVVVGDEECLAREEAVPLLPVIFRLFLAASEANAGYGALRPHVGIFVVGARHELRIAQVQLHPFFLLVLLPCGIAPRLGGNLPRFFGVEGVDVG